MRRVWLGALALVLSASTVAAPLWSQDQRPDTERTAREQIQQHFAERVQEELKLTDKQAARLRATMKTFADQRQKLRDRERTIRQGLADRLRPGATADEGRVAKLTDELVDLRIEYAKTFRNELKELSGYLTPVQRAQLFSMRERLFRAAQRERDRRTTSDAERKDGSSPDRSTDSARP